MTDTTDVLDTSAPGTTPGGRRTPAGSDVKPTLALALGVLALVAAPVVIWLVNVGPAGLLVPIAGIAASRIAKNYQAEIDYSPPGDPIMRRAQLGRTLGITGALVFLIGGLATWIVGNIEQLRTLQTLLFDVGRMVEAFPVLLTEGLRITLIVWIGAVVIGQILGVVIALMAISRRRIFRVLSLIYIDIFRGLPAIVTIVLVGIAMPLAGLRPFGRNPVFYGAFALGLVATAYIAEIVRAGIQSIDEGQMEAARSLGMPHGKAMGLIIIPQGIRRVVPPLTNEYIALLKDTSLMFVIGLVANSSSFFEGRDLYRVGTNLAQQNGNYSAVVLAGLFYLVMTIPLTRLTNYLDRRLREGHAAEDRSFTDDEDDLLPGTTGPIHGHGGGGMA